MKKLLMAALAAGVLMTAGCTSVLSLKPFVKEGAGILDPTMTGTWMEEGGDVYVIQPKEGNRYDVVYVPSGNNDPGQRFDGRLFAAGAVRFMDLTPKSGQQCLFCWPAHALVRVWLTETELRFAFIDSEWFRQQIEKEGLPFEPLSDAMLLTSDTATLAARVLPYAIDSRAQGGEQHSGKPDAITLHKKL